MDFFQDMTLLDIFFLVKQVDLISISVFGLYGFVELQLNWFVFVFCLDSLIQ